MRYPALSAILALSACTVIVKDGDSDTDATPDGDTDTAGIIGPRISIDPASVDFGMIPNTCVAPWREVTISNIGDETLQITDLAAIGNPVFPFDNAAWPLPASVQAGSHVLLPVRFEPVAVGTFAGNIRITSNDPDRPETSISLAGGSTSDTTVTESFTQASVAALDVLFVIDNSGEMSGEITALNGWMDEFLAALGRLSVDYRIGVVTTDMDEPTDSGRIEGAIITASTSNPAGAFAALTAGVGSGSSNERPLDAANVALSSPLIDTVNIGLNRTATRQLVVVVTNADDASVITGVSFTTWLNSLQGDPALTALSLIAGPMNASSPCTTTTSGVPAEPTPILGQVAASTGGVHVDMCPGDYEQALLDIGAGAIGYQWRHALQFAPTSGTLEVRLDGSLTTSYTYDAVTNEITFSLDQLPAVGVEVTVTYQANC